MEHSPRFQATYKCQHLGWFDTLKEAEAAIKKAMKKEKQEDKAFLAWLRNKE